MAVRSQKCYRVVVKMVTPPDLKEVMHKSGLYRSAPLQPGEKIICASSPQAAGEKAEKELTAYGVHVVRLKVLSKEGKLLYRRKVRGIA